MKKYFLILFLTVSIISWLLLIPSFVKDSYTLVMSDVASTQKIVNKIDCKGTIIAEKEVNLVNFMPIKILENYHHEGDTVNVGDTLLKIDSDYLKNSTSANSNSKGITNESSVNKNNALNALEQALSMGLINKETYDELKDKLGDNKEIDLSSSINQYLDENKITDEQVNSLVDKLENSLKSSIKGTIVNIKSPSDGLISASSNIATVVDMNSLEVLANVDESNIKDIKIGQSVSITGDGFYGEYQGKVKEINPTVTSEKQLTTQKNYVKVLVTIDKIDKYLLPGFSVKLSIIKNQQDKAITIPFDFIKQNDDGTEYVYVFKEGRAVKKSIVTGEDYEDSVQVISGIEVGDTILTDINDSIYDNKKVRIN